MKDLRVYFLDWYDWILPRSSSDNIFIWILKKHFNVIIDDKNPDVLFYSLAYNKHLDFKNCLKIYVNSEPLFYNNLELYDKNLRHIISIDDADYIITSYKSNIDKNYYMPIFLLWLYHHIFVTKEIESFDCLTKYRDINKKNDFCVFLHKNMISTKRNLIFEKLKDYKYIHTKENLILPFYGSIEKINSLKSFKFSFAMQNHYHKEDNPIHSNVSGLIDEKVIESLISGTIPLYYGNENVGSYLNNDAILNYHDFNDDEAFINEIIKIDNSSNLYKDISTQPIVKDLKFLKIDKLEEFLLKIIK